MLNNRWLKLAPSLLLDNGRLKLALSLLLNVLQMIWLSVTADQQIGLLNAIPGLILFPITVFFAAHAWDRAALQWGFIALVFWLTLHLPVTLAPELIAVNWFVFSLVAGMLLLWVRDQLRDQGLGKAGALAVILILFNGLSHIGQESPYNHTFHLLNGLSSDFQGVDNNLTWECAYEVSFFPVHCDARHFIASEIIFTDSAFDPSYSVVLSRYFDGYLKSLVGIEGQRWLSSMGVHLLFWLLACAAVFRLARLFNLSPTTARAAGLSVASWWGFVAMFSQPAPYFLSYAFAIFMLWAVAELVQDRTRNRSQTLQLGLIIVAATQIYELYPLLVACLLVLWGFGRRSTALWLVAGVALNTVLWRKVGLIGILGTPGDLDSFASGASNIGRDIEQWARLFSQQDVAAGLGMLWTGVQQYLYGNLIVPAVAALVVLVGCYRRLQASPPQSLFWWMLLLANGAMLGAAIFIVPQTTHYSPATGMQPRIVSFAIGLNLIALCYLAARLPRHWVYSTPALMLIIANLDQTGLGSVAMLFDYGRWGVFWY